MNCPSCNKFAALEMQDPEVNSLEVDEDGQVTAEVRIARNSECCGDEMKEATLSLESEEGRPNGCRCEPAELTVDEDSCEPTDEGGSRYQKSYFGASLECTVTCQICKKTKAVTMSDKVAASEMEELN
jgi:hypothetical protein